MSARSRSVYAALPWSFLAVASAVSLAAALSTRAFSLPYGLTAGAMFGLLLGSIGVIRNATGKVRRGFAGLSQQDVAFAGAFAIVAAAGCCFL